MFMSVLLVVFAACTSPSTQETPSPTAVTASGGAGSGGEGKARSAPKGKSTKGKPPAKGKASGGAGGKGKPAVGNARSAPLGKSKKKGEPPPPIGVAGPVTAALTLAPGGTPEAVKTKASLKFTWEGGEKEVPLGEAEGTCKEIPAEEITSEDGQTVTPAWLVSCAKGETEASRLAIVQKDLLMTLRRAPVAEGKTGQFRVLRKMKLAEGAVFTKG